MLLDFIFGAIILILIALGIYKGLTGLFFGTFSVILSLLIAFFLADVVAQQIFISPLGDTLVNFINGKLASFGEIMTAPIIKTGEDYFLDTTEGTVAIADAFQSMGVFGKIFGSYAVKIIPSLDIEGMSLADKFVPVIAKLALSLVSGVALFILAALILKIFGKVSENWKENAVFNKIDKVLGTLIMAFIGMLIINFCMLAAAEAPHVSIFNALAEMTDGTYMSKFFYEHNLLKMALNGMGVDTAEMFLRYFPA